jgi:hypothetical protein
LRNGTATAAEVWGPAPTGMLTVPNALKRSSEDTVPARGATPRILAADILYYIYTKKLREIFHRNIQNMLARLNDISVLSLEPVVGELAEDFLVIFAIPDAVV